MTKKEYDKITELLKKIERYNDLIDGLINADNNEIRGTYCDRTICYSYKLEYEEKEDLKKYFQEKLDDINNQLKELGYND